MQYTILLHSDSTLIQRLINIKGLVHYSIPNLMDQYARNLPKIHQKWIGGQAMESKDIHQIFDLASTAPEEDQQLLLSDYPQSLANAQDFLHYAKLKGWVLNHCIYFKPSAQQKKALQQSWNQQYAPLKVQELWQQFQKQQRTYQEILALLPFNQAQELMADQPLLQLYQKVLRICKF